MKQKKYDVFISYSRKDYVDEHKNVISGNEVSKIKEALTKAGITYWFDEDGVFSGQKFMAVISDAIADSKMMVFVSSKNSNSSSYTAGEIIEAINGGKGIIPIRIDDSNYNKHFRILLNPVDYIDYKAHPKTALEDLLRAVNREKKRIEEIEADAENQRIIETAKKEIKERATEYNTIAGQQDIILKDLYAKNKIIGNIKKLCPVCGKEVLIQSLFCDKCGWQFPSLYSLDGREMPVCDETQLSLARAHWRSLDDIVTLQEDIKSKEKEINKEKCKNAELIRQFEMLERRQKEIEEELYKKENENKGKEEFDQEGNNLKERIFNIENVTFKMIQVKGGQFQMGASDSYLAFDDEKPQHWVKLKDYYIGETVVTQSLWKAVMGENNNPSNWKGDELPVETVSWNDAKDFIEKLNEKLSLELLDGAKFRLPTEAEWEYAARGGDKSVHEYRYSGSDKIDEVAWYEDNSWYKTHIVKKKKANELSLYDMSGNVWEWCEDWYGQKYYSQNSIDNPKGPSSGTCRVLRGGGWSDNPKGCRVSYRRRIDPSRSGNNIGFRIVIVY